MDLKQLETFVRVAELGSFTRAASALGVAQPALSRQVRQLEVELRQHLLLRNGRGATPTEAGKLLLEHARGILHQVQRARDELARGRGEWAGQIAIGLPPSLARSLAVPLLRALRHELPHARPALCEGLSATMQEWLASGRLDVALLYNALPNAEIDCTPLGQQALVLVRAAPAGRRRARSSALSLAEVAALPLVIPSRPNAIRMCLEAEMAAAGLQPQVALEIDGVSAILELVAEGLGCAILSRQALHGSPQPGAYLQQPIEHAGQPLAVRVALATSALHPATPTQQAAQAVLRRVCAAQLEGLG